jgi:hypothetical protein
MISYSKYMKHCMHNIYDGIKGGIFKWRYEHQYLLQQN